MTVDERKADREATRDAHLKACIDKAVAWPPLTAEQITRISLIMWPNRHSGGTARVPTERQKTLEKIAGFEHDLAAERKTLEDELAGCHGCGLTKEVHIYQGDYYGGYHEWVPLSPDDMIKTIRAHKPKLAAIEKKIAALT